MMFMIDAAHHQRNAGDGTTMAAIIEHLVDEAAYGVRRHVSKLSGWPAGMKGVRDDAVSSGAPADRVRSRPRPPEQREPVAARTKGGRRR
jgi:hypothetical protein